MTPSRDISPPGHECCECVEAIDLAKAKAEYVEREARARVVFAAGIGLVLTPFFLYALQFAALMNGKEFPIDTLVISGALGGVALVMTAAWGKKNGK